MTNSSLARIGRHLLFLGSLFSFLFIGVAAHCHAQAYQGYVEQSAPAQHPQIVPDSQGTRVGAYESYYQLNHVYYGEYIESAPSEVQARMLPYWEAMVAQCEPESNYYNNYAACDQAVSAFAASIATWLFPTVPQEYQPEFGLPCGGVNQLLNDGSVALNQAIAAAQLYGKAAIENQLQGLQADAGQACAASDQSDLRQLASVPFWQGYTQGFAAAAGEEFRNLTNAGSAADVLKPGLLKRIARMVEYLGAYNDLRALAEGSVAATRTPIADDATQGYYAGWHAAKMALATIKLAPFTEGLVGLVGE